MSAREVAVAITNQGDVITAPWIDPTERVAWLNWTQRAWGVETPVSGDDLARRKLADAAPSVRSFYKGKLNAALAAEGHPITGYTPPF